VDASPTQLQPVVADGGRETRAEGSECPLCGARAYGWLTLPDPTSRPTVGLPATVSRVIDRCEDCGAGVERTAGPIDLPAELDRIAEARPDGTRAVRGPNRASVQAAIGAEGWAALADWDGGLLLTPRALRLLGARTGHEVRRLRSIRAGRNQRWMWQTLLNGLTLHPNFAHEVLAGRLRPSSARGPGAFAVDCVVTVLAAPLVALVSFPLELVAAVARRGGELSAELER